MAKKKSTKATATEPEPQTDLEEAVAEAEASADDGEQAADDTAEGENPASVDATTEADDVPAEVSSHPELEDAVGETEAGEPNADGVPYAAPELVGMEDPEYRRKLDPDLRAAEEDALRARRTFELVTAAGGDEGPAYDWCLGTFVGEGDPNGLGTVQVCKRELGHDGPCVYTYGDELARLEAPREEVVAP